MTAVKGQVSRLVLTSWFKLPVLLAFEDRVRDPEPGVLLPHLGDEVVGDHAHCPRQRIQHNGDKRLDRGERGRKGE